MKLSKAILSFFTVAAVLAPVVGTLSGNREGNGGDHIRSTFIKSGKAVLHYLRTSDAGIALAEANHLDLDLLEGGLDIEKISVVEGPLVDNGGSDVDATGEPGKITLRKESWYEHFERERDVYYLVFHEMLRQAAVNDDNYVISAGIDPFPTSDKVITRIASILPLISSDDVTPFLPKSARDIVLGGAGCPEGSLYLDLDKERGILDLSFKKFNLKGQTERSQCALRMPIFTSALNRLVISQIDLSGRLNLPAGGALAISLSPNLGATAGPVAKKVVRARGDELGRFSVRTTPNFATACESSKSILGLNSALLLSSPEGKAAVNVDRLSVYFRVEACVPESVDRSR